MNGDKINDYMNKKCYDCCPFKKENMELYKLNLRNEKVNKIMNYSMDEKVECENCQEWRDNQFLIKCLLKIKGKHNRNIENEILIFLFVNKIPPYDYLKSVRTI